MNEGSRLESEPVLDFIPMYVFVVFSQNIAMNIDEFKSRFHWLCTKHAPDYQPRNVLNDDFSFSTYATIARWLNSS